MNQIFIDVDMGHEVWIVRVYLSQKWAKKYKSHYNFDPRPYIGFENGGLTMTHTVRDRRDVIVYCADAYFEPVELCNNRWFGLLTPYQAPQGVLEQLRNLIREAQIPHSVPFQCPNCGVPFQGPYHGVPFQGPYHGPFQGVPFQGPDHDPYYGPFQGVPFQGPEIHPLPSQGSLHDNPFPQVNQGDVIEEQPPQVPHQVSPETVPEIVVQEPKPVHHNLVVTKILQTFAKDTVAKKLVEISAPVSVPVTTTAELKHRKQKKTPAVWRQKSSQNTNEKVKEPKLTTTEPVKEVKEVTETNLGDGTTVEVPSTSSDVPVAEKADKKKKKRVRNKKKSGATVREDAVEKIVVDDPKPTIELLPDVGTSEVDSSTVVAEAAGTTEVATDAADDTVEVVADAANDTVEVVADAADTTTEVVVGIAEVVSTPASGSRRNTKRKKKSNKIPSVDELGKQLKERWGKGGKEKYNDYKQWFTGILTKMADNTTTIVAALMNPEFGYHCPGGLATCLFCLHSTKQHKDIIDQVCNSEWFTKYLARQVLNYVIDISKIHPTEVSVLAKILAEYGILTNTIMDVDVDVKAICLLECVEDKTIMKAECYVAVQRFLDDPSSTSKFEAMLSSSLPVCSALTSAIKSYPDFKWPHYTTFQILSNLPPDVPVPIDTWRNAMGEDFQEVAKRSTSVWDFTFVGMVRRFVNAIHQLPGFAHKLCELDLPTCLDTVLSSGNFDLGTLNENKETILFAALNSPRIFTCLLKVHFLKNRDLLDVFNSQGKTVFHVAVMTCDIAIVRFLIEEEYYGVASECQRGLTPLHYAAQNPNPEVLRYLLQQEGTDILKENHDNRLAFCHAVCAGIITNVYTLLDYLKSRNLLSEYISSVGETVVHTVAKYSNFNLDLLKRLLDKDAYNCSSLINNRTTDNGYTALGSALLNGGKKKFIKCLLENGADPNAPSNSDDNTAFHMATCFSDTPTVTMLLEKGANPSARNNMGRTPLHVSALNKATKSRIGIAEVLLHYDESLIHQTDDEGHTILHFACVQKDIDFVDYLLQKGADVNAESKGGHTPLHTAVRTMDKALVSRILDESKCCINSRTTFGDTVLHIACRHFNQAESAESTKIVELLLEKEASVTGQTKEGLTVLHLACLHTTKKVVEQILQKGASINDKIYANGYTVLHIACLRTDSEVVEWIIKKGASVTDKTEEGYTSLHCAVQHKDSSVARGIIGLLIRQDKSLLSTHPPVLLIAAQKGSGAMVRYLVEKYGLDPLVKDSDNKGIMEYVEENENEEERDKLRAMFEPMSK